MRHPRIVRVEEYGVDEHGAFYTMELLEGSDLSKCAPMPWREVSACLRDAASLLGVLHARRLLHRDLSPRNLWRTPDGRLKLLDFGALAPFGVAQELVGTAPFVAPEALHGKPLDQRMDLFALGALGYWLLTGTHAFGATSFAELTSVWRTAPLAPSALVELMQGGAHDVPPELDLLMGSLLRLDPDERPRSTEDVVNHLNAIAGLSAEAEDVVVRGYLDSNAFVGRATERDRFAKLLRKAERGATQALLIEGPEGVGRTRLLEELTLAARISGATTVLVEAEPMGRPYGTAAALLRALCKVLPRETCDAAAPQVGLLASLSPDLPALLRTEARSARFNDPIEERSRRQSALSELVLTLARRRTLVLLIDDLQRADEESQALIATLARAPLGARLLLVGAVRTAAHDALAPGLRGFASVARKLLLPALREPEMRELLRSIFGEVPYLDRLCARLHRLSDGVPSHALSLVRKLVASRVARYADGAWALPTELPDDLPNTLRGSVLAGLDGLAEEMRALLRLASVSNHGPVSIEMLAALAAQSPEEIERVVGQLLSRRLLRASGDGLQLAHPALREPLYAELSEQARARAHLAMAELLRPQSDLLSQVGAGLHLLRAGRMRVGEVVLCQVSRQLMTGARDYPRAMAAMFAEALTLLRAAGRDDYAQIPLLNALAVAGYQVDRAYAARYGDDALVALQRVLRFSLARRARRYLGGKLSLLLALLVATVLMVRRRAAMNALEAVRWLITNTGYLMGPAAMSLDRDKLCRYAELFEPLLALGPDHAVSWLQRFCRGLSLSLEDRCADAQRVMGGVLARLRDPRPIRALPDGNRRNLLGAASYAYGMRETFACDVHLLGTADELGRGSPMHSMQADQLRAIYYSYRGETERAADCEQRVERMAVQLGTAWQAELFAPRQLWRIALWTLDLAAHKRAARALSRLAQELPAFALSARRAQGAELVLRGKFQEAVALLDDGEQPLAELGWVAARALLAMAHNGLGQHERAKQVCLHALAQLTQEDRAFVIQNLTVEIELALAEARLAGADVAQRRLAELVIAHAHRGPLTLGLLHRAQTRVALIDADHDRAEQHLAAMEACYRPTRIASLLIACSELRLELRQLRAPQQSAQLSLSSDEAHLLMRVDQMCSERGDMAERALAALQVALELSNADRGFVLHPDSNDATAWMGVAPSEEVQAWARVRLNAALANQSCTELVSDDALLRDDGDQSFEAGQFTVTLLWCLVHGEERPVAALVLGCDVVAATTLPTAVLRLMGQRLREAQRRSESNVPLRG